ncbi:MAG: ATP-binding protein [Gammaproteobacteria bacterium]|nr:ATP-binding protein [Gammaproteobacteria bacterium]
MYNRLLWKLLAINIPVVAGVILVVWLAIDYLAADYFAVLMEEYHVSPNDAHGIFLNAVHRYLLGATLCAFALAAALSFLLTRKVLRPLSEMMQVTRRLSDGDYTARVQVQSKDEIGRLGAAFNRMADNLERIERLRKTMVADAAHELRTPLTNIRGYLEGLQEGVVSPSQETFEMLHSEMLRLVRLSEDLLSLARADAAKLDLRPQPFSMRDLVEEVLDFNRLRLSAKDLKAEVRFHEGADAVLADRDKLLQAVRNLFDNAWQYTPPGGRIHVSARPVPEGLRVSFVNTGQGIAAEDLPYIFERFYRADKSRSRDHGGAGIGLSIVKELVEAHDGKVGATSADGQTTVWFTLPC